jgi:membrane protease subunit HflC
LLARRTPLDAAGRDQDFFAFYRSMQAYETAMRDSSTTMVLSPQSEFFRYFENGAGGGGAPARR